MAQRDDGRWTKREALLLTIFPFAALSALNHFYSEPLVALHPAMFWLMDFVHCGFSGLGEGRRASA